MEQSKKQYDLALIGGDDRIAYMAPFFIEKGYRVICYGTKQLEEHTINPAKFAKTFSEAVEESKYIVGGVPLFKKGKLFGGDTIQEISEENFYHCLESNQVVFGGVIPRQFEMICREKNVTCYDFLKDEALAIFNAIATAEGTILETIKNSKTNLHGSKTLVLGFGRCAKILCDKLKGMGAKVTVCVRNKEQLAYAKAYGYAGMNLVNLSEQIGDYEYIFNTIPAKVLGQNQLGNMRRDVIVIDIASGEGGTDFLCAKRMGIRAMQCLGLPGKYAPKGSAEGLVQYVISKME